MTTTNERKFQKQPAEAYPIAIDYTNRLPSGLTLASGTVSGTNLATGSADNSVLSSTTATLDGNKLKVKIQAGAHGTDYKITFLAALSDSSVLEDEIIMQVRAL